MRKKEVEFDDESYNSPPVKTRKVSVSKGNTKFSKRRAIYDEEDSSNESNKSTDEVSVDQSHEDEEGSGNVGDSGSKDKNYRRSTKTPRTL